MDLSTGEPQGDSPPSSEAKRAQVTFSNPAAAGSSRNDEAVQATPDLPSPVQSPQAVNKNAINALRRRKQDLHESYRAYLSRLQKSGITEIRYTEAKAKSLTHESSIEEVLLAEGAMREEDYFKCVADDLALPFSAAVNPERIMTDIGLPSAIPGKAAQVFSRSATGTVILYLAPNRNSELAIRELLEDCPEQKHRLCITTRKAIRDALEQRAAINAAEVAANALYHKHPNYSAKQTFMPWQSFLSGLVVILLPYVLYNAPGATLAIAHLIASCVFLFGVYLRIGAIRTAHSMSPANYYEGHSFPLYTVMIALYREASVASQLINAMSKLDWPAECLEVLYLCESDDAETAAALRENGFPPNHRIVTVPAGLPRTKPKALNYGLGFASGDFVVIFDAEDRPHPSQLKEAFQTFRSGENSLVCLQAPLDVTNSASSWFSHFFAFEYRTHFHGLLPHLAKRGLPLPLGGTSNHFKRDILVKAGAWDPFNVTEDADLGIRLARLGYITGVLKSPTYEDAPETVREWLPQRTRWQKGWMQTALVHSRNLNDFIRSSGPIQAFYTAGIVGGLILAPMLYPLGLASFAYSISQHAQGYGLLAILDILIFTFGFLAYALLGFACDEKKPWKERVKIVAGLPIYWLWISAASWLALAQLVLNPHHWNKTPHRPTRV